jgi:hypothetical protein
MRKFVLAAATAAAATFAAASACAAPISPGIAPPASTLVPARGFCGLGWHRSYYGVCVPNGGPFYGPYAYAPPPPRCWWVATAYGPRRVCAW